MDTKKIYKLTKKTQLKKQCFLQIPTSKSAPQKDISAIENEKR